MHSSINSMHKNTMGKKIIDIHPNFLLSRITPSFIKHMVYIKTNIRMKKKKKSQFAAVAYISCNQPTYHHPIFSFWIILQHKYFCSFAC